MAGFEDYLIFDLEFTTHDTYVGRPRAFFPEIIEVGAILLAPPEWQPGWSYQTFVKPRMFPRLTAACTGITMIQQTDVDGGIPVEEVFAQLLTVYRPGKTGLVAWGESDRQVIDEQCRRYKMECPFDWSDYIDLSAAYRDYYQHRRRLSLKHAVEERKIERKGFYHLALDDAENTGLLLVHMLQDGWNVVAGVQDE